MFELFTCLQSDTLRVSGAFPTPACHKVGMELLTNMGPHSALPVSLLKARIWLKGDRSNLLGVSGERAEVATGNHVSGRSPNQTFNERQK